MTPIADMVEKLIAAGVASELILVAIRAAEQTAVRGIPVDKVDESAERRRAYDRDRKRKVRGIPPENPQNSADQDSALSSKEKEGSNKPKTERKRGEKIPPDWKPTEGHYAEGAEMRIDRQQVERQAEDMRLWARANEHRAVARKSDWDLTFSGWMRRNSNGHGPSNGRADSASRPGASGADAILAGMGRLAARVGSAGGPARPADGQIPAGFDLARGPDPDRDTSEVDRAARRRAEQDMLADAGTRSRR